MSMKQAQNSDVQSELPPKSEETSTPTTNPAISQFETHPLHVQESLMSGQYSGSDSYQMDSQDFCAKENLTVGNTNDNTPRTMNKPSATNISSSSHPQHTPNTNTYSERPPSTAPGLQAVMPTNTFKSYHPAFSSSIGSVLQRLAKEDATLSSSDPEPVAMMASSCDESSPGNPADVKTKEFRISAAEATENSSSVTADSQSVLQRLDIEQTNMIDWHHKEQSNQSNITSSNLPGNIESVCPEAEHGNDSLVVPQEQQHHPETFIGPVAPSNLQAMATPQEQMDVDLAYEEEKLQEAVTECYDFSNRSVPSFVTWARTEYLKASSENFLRGCKWSPDGSQVLTNSNDNTLRVFNMSDEITENDASSSIEQVSEVAMRESSTLHDYAWHPAMSSHQPNHCRIATTCSGIPIHLWDSVQGKIRASYKAYDQYDEITAAYSLSFGTSGNQIFGGYKKAIRVFDLEYPGKKCKLIKTCGPKRTWSSQPGQTGIISCFAHSPTTEGSLAAGSYTRHIGLYDLRCDGLTCVIEGQRGGITHLMFTPDGNMLLSGARKDNEILCWDMRNLGTVCFSALRDVRTNQRMYFDITRSGRYMASGNDDGTVTFWDLKQPADMIDSRPYLKPVAQFQAHNDSVNGVSFHPSGNFLATSSGQRHFQDFGKNDSSDSSDGDDEEIAVMDFSLRVWRMPLARACTG